MHPVSWNEASILERRFVPGITPEEALLIAADFLHDDYAYVFDAFGTFGFLRKTAMGGSFPITGIVLCSWLGIRRRGM